MAKPKQSSKYLGISDVVGAQRSKSYQLNFGRFTGKYKKGGNNLNSAYLIVAKKIIEDYKKGTIKTSDFKFKPDVFKVLKYMRENTK